MELSDIPVIICNYKYPDLTKRCVKSFRTFYPDTKIILIDDLSPNYEPFNFENSLEIRQKEHLGHGAAMDLGVKVAKTPWVFTLDHDVLFTKGGFLEQLWEQRNGYKAVGPTHTTSLDGDYINAALALWNVNIIKKYDLSFLHYDIPGRPYINPGVLLCRKLEELGYSLNYLDNKLVNQFGEHYSIATYSDLDYSYGKNYKL